jgi:protocatechuate 3,4-dioxygenase beta subunit
MRQLLFTCVFAFCIAALTNLQAQSTYGTITGSVTDPTGAAISGAKVEATNQGTNDSRTTLTDAQGIYLFPNLIPGSYTISVSSDKFAPSAYLQK